jgi:hypothetical protein
MHPVPRLDLELDAAAGYKFARTLWLIPHSTFIIFLCPPELPCHRRTAAWLSPASSSSSSSAPHCLCSSSSSHVQVRIIVQHRTETLRFWEK